MKEFPASARSRLRLRGCDPRGMLAGLLTQWRWAFSIRKTGAIANLCTHTLSHSACTRLCTHAHTHPAAQHLLGLVEELLSSLAAAGAELRSQGFLETFISASSPSLNQRGGAFEVALGWHLPLCLPQ